jgi:hypothetical protein
MSPVTISIGLVYHANLISVGLPIIYTMAASQGDTVPVFSVMAGTQPGDRRLGLEYAIVHPPVVRRLR